MDSIGRLLSRPRVKGTIQKLHMFSQPRMIELRSERKEGGGRRGAEEKGGGMGRRGGCEMGRKGWEEK